MVVLLSSKHRTWPRWSLVGRADESIFKRWAVMHHHRLASDDGELLGFHLSAPVAMDPAFAHAYFDTKRGRRCLPCVLSGRPVAAVRYGTGVGNVVYYTCLGPRVSLD